MIIAQKQMSQDGFQQDVNSLSNQAPVYESHSPFKNDYSSL